MRNNWSFTELVRKYGSEEAALAMLPTMRGYGQATTEVRSAGAKARFEANESECLICGAVVRNDSLCGCQR